MLTGEAKKIYQREYMRKRRAVRPIKELGLKGKALSMLDQTLTQLKDSTLQAKVVNDKLGEVLETMKKKQKIRTVKPKFLIVGDIVTCKCGKPMHKVTFPDIGLCWSCDCGEYIMIEDILAPDETQEVKSTTLIMETKICPTCGGKGYREFEAGLIRLACPECRGEK